jgi:aminocarboxymuconate-semialdehyde decarboxylase
VIDLDVHAHLAPVNPASVAQIDGVQWLPQEKALVVDGHRVGIKALFEPQSLVTWMDRNAVRRALVSIPPPLYRQHLSRDAAAAWARCLNQELLAICGASHGRLEALFHLPMEHPGLLPELLQEATGFAGVALAAGGHPAIEYSHPHYAPLWEWLDARSSFVFIHPGTCQDCRLAQFYMENLVGNPYETGVAATHLIMAGVPSRYPRIRFCLAHAGGVFPALVGRLQRGFDTARPGVNVTVEHPLQAARRFYADGIAHHPAALALAKEVLGADHILFGSDWPFPMGLEQATDRPGPHR